MVASISEKPSRKSVAAIIRQKASDVLAVHPSLIEKGWGKLPRPFIYWCYLG